MLGEGEVSIEWKRKQNKPSCLLEIRRIFKTREEEPEPEPEASASV